MSMASSSALRWIVVNPRAQWVPRVPSKTVLILGTAAQRQLLHSSGERRLPGSFFNGLSSSLCDAFQFGRRSPRFQMKGGPTGDKDKYYPGLGELKITYGEMVQKIKERIELSIRLEREALDNKGKRHRHDMLLGAQGFTLGVRESTISGAGRGLFLTRGGFKAGEIVTLYPGVVYTINTILDIAARESLTEFGAPVEPMLPLFLLKNAYLLSERKVLFADGWHSVDLMADGNPFHQSALRFLQERRDQSADRSWLELTHPPHPSPDQDKEQYYEEILLSERGVGQALKRGFTHTDLDNRSMLSLGHLINHSQDATVRMIFVPMPIDFSKDLLAQAPTVNAHPFSTGRWVVAVVAVKDVDKTGTELFMNYGRNPTSIGWQGPKTHI